MASGTLAGWLLVVVVAGSIEGFRVETEAECMALSERLRAVLEVTLPKGIAVSVACLRTDVEK